MEQPVQETASFQYTRKTPLYERIVFIDGLARSGKSLVGRIVSHFKGGEQWQCQTSIEMMCYLNALGQINDTSSASFIQFAVEANTYNQIIGRYLNTRPSDLSSIYNSPDPEAVLKRAQTEDGMVAVNRSNLEKRFSVFQLHSTLMASGLLLEAVPTAKIIHLNRHPVDLAYKWFQRGWGKREPTDPLSFVPIIKTADGVAPWFAQGWERKFLNGNHLERIIDSVVYLNDWDDRGYSALDKKKKQNIFRFALEDLFTTPDAVVENIGKFLETDPRREMGAMLLEERCPRDAPLKERQSMFEEIIESVSPDHEQRLLTASRAYESRWSLPPFGL